MTSPGLVSAIVPTYNRARQLPRAIDSALAQTHPDIEMLVVDDGSTDGTPEMLRARYGGDTRVRVFRQENRGVSAARNRGIAEARGDFVAFLDSDDVWKPWKISLQLACLDRLPQCGMVFTEIEAIAPDGRIDSPRYLHQMYRTYRWFPRERLFSGSVPLENLPKAAQASAEGAHLWWGDIFGPMVVGNLIPTPTVLIRRDRLSVVRGFDESLGRAGEDHDFHLRTCRAGPVAFADVASTSCQIGEFDDKLSRLSDVIARNYLKTLTRSLAEDRARIHLPPPIIREALALAHGWVAETLLENGDRHGALRHLIASLLHRPWQPRVLAQLGLCALPIKPRRIWLTVP